MSSKKLLLFLAVLVAVVAPFVVVAPAQAAPIMRLERTLIPETDSLYDLGTTTQAWREAWFDRVCFTADTCRTSWPSGGGGSNTGTVGTSSVEVANYVPKWTTTAAGTALLAGTSLIYDSGTNVGIGTTSPATNLHIFSAGAGTTLRIDTQSSTALAVLSLTDVNTSAGASNIYYTPSGAANTNILSVPNSSGFQVGTGGTGGFYFNTRAPAASINFATGGNAFSNIRMIITGTGNVGIGTSTPGTRFGVNGDAVIAGLVTAQYFTATSTSNSSIFPYASTTAITATTASSTNLVVSSVPASLLKTTGGGIVSAASAGTDYAAAGNYITALTGDVSATGPGSVAATLATVNANTGSFGGSTAIPNFTVNGKGLITAAGTSVVIAPAGTLTGATLNSTVTASSLTSVGTLTSLTVSGQTSLQGASSTVFSSSYASSTDLRAGKFSGAGLTDCANAVTSKLLYTAATGLFSCGTDQSGSGTVTAVTGSYPIVSSGGTTPNITFAGLSTTTTWTVGQLAMVASNNTVSSVATGTISSGGAGISVTAGQSIIGSGLTITNTGVTSLVAGTNISISGSTGAVTVTGIGYPFPNNATSTLITFNAGAVLSTSTIGTLNAGSITASSSLTLPLITSKTLNTDQNGGVYGTATSTPTVTTPITYSGTLGSFIGGVSGAFACATCITQATATSTITGTTGQTVYMQGTNSPIGTSTIFIDTMNDVGISSTSPLGTLTVGTDNMQTGKLSFIIGSSTKTDLVVTQGGNVGIGTTSPYGLLSLNAPAGISPYFVIGSSSEALKVVPSTGTFLGVATSSPWRTLSVTGTAAINGLSAASAGTVVVCIDTTTKELKLGGGAATCAPSIASEKRNIELNTTGIQELMKIPVVTFYFKEHEPQQQIGFIAQTLDSIDPRLTQRVDGILTGLRLDNIVALVVKSVQDLKAYDDIQDQQIKELRTQIEQLKLQCSQ